MNGATTIQERLKDLRLNKGLKLEELAEQTGISKSALGSYEKDDYKEINHGNLILLADFYGVSLDYLFWRSCIRSGTGIHFLGCFTIEKSEPCGCFLPNEID